MCIYIYIYTYYVYMCVCISYVHICNLGHLGRLRPGYNFDIK